MTQDDALKIRESLQNIVDCYGLGLQGKKREVHLYAFIDEAVKVLNGVKLEEFAIQMCNEWAAVDDSTMHQPKTERPDWEHSSPEERDHWRKLAKKFKFRPGSPFPDDVSA